MPDSLFPPIEPFDQGRLDTGDGHSIYYEQCGNPGGVPVVVLHGGPGSGSSPQQRRFFDPRHYRIILFDQRGCGRSRPLGATENNTTQVLTGDIEALRERFGIGRWLVFGGSWGATLALAYAQAHPDRVAGLILRGVFLATRAELEWYCDGLRHFLPEAWAAFSEAVNGAAGIELIARYHRRVHGTDAAAALAAARAWYAYDVHAIIAAGGSSSGNAPPDDQVLAQIKVQTHYLVHNCFIDETQLLNRVDRIRRIPAIIVQGRLDLVCPPATACALSRAWPEADFVMVENGGHSAFNAPMAEALVAACERFKTIGAAVQ
ncbi:MAG TPA: prolyl aminopeptidase [Burkholderiales bacterium]|jgi:proline iminopeptidase|nr:prolyl aminopeptidase [Burkholderiales bacterium]